MGSAESTGVEFAKRWASPGEDAAPRELRALFGRCWGLDGRMGVPTYVGARGGRHDVSARRHSSMRGKAGGAGGGATNAPDIGFVQASPSISCSRSSESGGSGAQAAQS